MREYCTSGSVRGAARKGSPYRGGRKRQPQMWVTIVESLETSWRAAPRQEVIAAIDSLRNAMDGCRVRYEWYCGARAKLGEGDGTVVDPNAEAFCAVRKVKWVMHVIHVIFALKELGEMLSIWSKDTQTTLALNSSGEEIEAYSSRMLRMLGRDLGKEPGIDIDLGEMEASFSEGWERLDVFMRASFSSEEIRHARQEVAARLEAESSAMDKAWVEIVKEEED